MTETVREVVPLEGRDGNRLDLEVVIEPGKRARLVTLTIHEIEGEGISPELVRKSVAGELSEMVRLASGLARALFLNRRLDAGDYEALDPYMKTTRLPDGGVLVNLEMSDSLLGPRDLPSRYEECAAVYLAAPTGHKVRAVMDNLHLSESAAKQLIKRTRDGGHLPALTQGKRSTITGKKGEKR